MRVVQGLIGSEQCAAAWAKVSDSSNATASNTMMDSIFLPFAVHQEVEQAKADGEKEEEAALNSTFPRVLDVETLLILLCRL